MNPVCTSASSAGACSAGVLACGIRQRLAAVSAIACSAGACQAVASYFWRRPSLPGRSPWRRRVLACGIRQRLAAGSAIIYRADQNSHHRLSHAGGFSLVEVLVAILILGVALAGLTQGISLAVNSSKESEYQTAAALFASGQIETLRVDNDLSDGETEGDCGEQLPLYRWRQTVTPAGISGLHEVAVVVENARTGQSIYELRTLLFQVPEDTTPRTGSSARRRGNR